MKKKRKAMTVGEILAETAALLPGKKPARKRRRRHVARKKTRR